MNIYIVASNTDTTYLVRSTNKHKAITLAIKDFFYRYGYVRNDFVAYEINDYMQNDNIIDIT